MIFHKNLPFFKILFYLWRFKYMFDSKNFGLCASPLSNYKVIAAYLN